MVLVSILRFALSCQRGHPCSFHRNCVIYCTSPKAWQNRLKTPLFFSVNVITCGSFLTRIFHLFCAGKFECLGWSALKLVSLEPCSPAIDWHHCYSRWWRETRNLWKLVNFLGYPLANAYKWLKEKVLTGWYQCGVLEVPVLLYFHTSFEYSRGVFSFFRFFVLFCFLFSQIHSMFSQLNHTNILLLTV